MNDVAAKLDPTHLTEGLTEDQMKKEIEQVQQEPASATAFDPSNPRLQSEYKFHFEWKDSRGKTWEGDFTSVIPTVNQRASIGAMRARLAGGMPFEAMDPTDLQNNFVLAHLTVFLKAGEGQRPSWAEDLFSIRDPDLLMAIWNEEVAIHEATFFGRG